LSDKRALACALSLVGLLLGSCGGGSQVDINPYSPPGPPVPGLSDPNSFLLFPNPQVQADGSQQTNTVAYSQAYYRAIDPTNAKDTLAKWKAANGFDSGTGTQVTVVFGDRRDLGYGRRMTGRQNVDGTVAVMVENYLVLPSATYSYSTINLDAAVSEDRRWHLGTNAIEFSPGPNGGLAFTKFFTFHPTTGERELTIDMDGRGLKAMPGPCITCHGGRGDPLTPPDGTGNPRFPLIANSPTGQRGDVLARMHPIEVDHVDFSAAPGFTRAQQEASIKTLNRMVLCTYPMPAASALPEDTCRRVAAANEWQGTGAQIIKSAYGGDGLPSLTFADTLVPTGWSTVGQTSLYRDVAANYCRACHILRGNASQSDLDFDSFAKFQGFADRIKAHVIDRGNMPLARIVYDAFIADSSAVTQLATFLEGQGFAVRDGGGAVLRAGRPIADPGPDRVVRQGAITLSATNSLYANAYQWSIVSGPAGATLTGAATAQPTFTSTADGTYIVQLVASGNGVSSTPAQLRIVVSNAVVLAAEPTSVRFSHIKTVLQNAGCTTACHIPGGTGGPPIVYSDIDRNGDGIVGDATDDLWFYTEVRGRVNFTDIVASPLLRKPSNNHHNGGAQPGFDTSVAPGQPTRANYDLFVNWILNGAPL
jgi:mono/diheme cytochrome c family protein